MYARGIQLGSNNNHRFPVCTGNNKMLPEVSSSFDCKKLQAEFRDIVSAQREIEIVIATIQDVRDNVQAHHSKWFATIENMCLMVGIVPSLPRRCGRQAHHSNMPADTTSAYYCRTISIPLYTRSPSL